MAFYWLRIHKVEFTKCVCMGNGDVLALLIFQVNRNEQIMNTEEQVLYISLIFLFQVLLFIHILELTLCRSNSILLNLTFHF